MMSDNYPEPVVYVVDDELAVRDSLALLIESTGYTVRSFESAESFLKNYDPEQPGCMLLDVRMPLMSGHDLQDFLLNKGIHIPIIFISGHADIPDSAKAFRAGAVDFMEKPFNSVILIERIEEALKKDLAFRCELANRQRIQERIERLTAREKEVLSLIVSSHSNKATAQILHISSRTVDVHRASIMEKMQAENVAELMSMVLFYKEPMTGSQEEMTN
jgi:FixJ family two-component response regulator